MADVRIDVDLARVVDDNRKLVTILPWGAALEQVDEDAKRVHVRLHDGREGFIAKKGGDPAVVPDGESHVLKVDFIDVQQGDGSVIETPGGKVILIDGGENKMFARYLARRFGGSSLQAPREIDAIVVSHGDADHFVGLVEVFNSEGEDKAYKQLFMQPRRVFHNGLVKHPSSVDEALQLGVSQKMPDGTTIITGLVDDLRQVPESDMNDPFKRWRKALDTYTSRGQLDMRRLQFGDDAAFDFLKPEGIETQVLGPIPITIDGVTGLKYLGNPSRHFGHQAHTTYSGISASHAINGQSVVLRFTYGDIRFVFAGDLNEESETTLVQDPGVDLEAEVFKVPHHGSAEFFPDFLEAVKPVVSVVSSGDESARKEYIHPRATLVAGLGRHSRQEEPVIFITELVAFFQKEGYVENKAPPPGAQDWARQDGFYAFSRAAFGAVHVRTDGKRLFVYTASGLDNLKEAYAFTIEGGAAVPQPVRQV
jgi:beta-lactamase superfamily II metal-dependent hydrolase